LFDRVRGSFDEVRLGVPPKIGASLARATPSQICYENPATPCLAPTTATEEYCVAVLGEGP